MYIILETFWSDTDDNHPVIMTDTEGRVKKFKTEEKAKKFSDRECHRGKVVEIC